ncbi:winged helix-turn-helix transcriptional regulator [Roseomonas aerophila]|uniref:Winged helix-turn-helix transcriptional regulator n=1 Tax=Teichococcus aerophilus TaxID=1224513 RepID=A0ABR7RQR2_9PROT|nr:metalloregulator ArsR/SmtB family transcription factor [Pseudoroseomonas aerophila]MBC9208743.1 winged helix-turn-helix transcriptional regulator [Pseudoroseomonas aerophila]
MPSARFPNGPGALGRVNDDEVVELAGMFWLMSDPTRLRIILACLAEPAPVGEMAERIGISASLASHHLRLLRAARLLQAERRGRQVLYAVTDPHIRSMLADMVDHVAEGESDIEPTPAPPA